MADLSFAGYRRLRQPGQIAERSGAVLEVPASQFTNDEWVHTGGAVGEQLREAHIALPEVIDPDGSVDQNHRALPDLRRRPASKLGMVPPRAASRRAASLETSSRKASWMRAVFS